MDLTIRSESFGTEDQSWLGSAHGTDATDPITLDGPAMLAAFPTGVIPSGVEVQAAATGRYGPRGTGAFTVAGTSGHVFTTVKVNADGGHVGAALLWHGEVIVSKLPASSGHDGASAAAIPHVRYVA